MRIVESKSLKLYLASFRNHGAFHEDCTVAIAGKIVDAIEPRWLRIGGYWYPRGGIPIDVFHQTGEPARRRMDSRPGRGALPGPGLESIWRRKTASRGQPATVSRRRIIHQTRSAPSILLAVMAKTPTPENWPIRARNTALSMGVPTALESSTRRAKERPVKL